jgi:hypothetical protein
MICDGIYCKGTTTLRQRISTHQATVTATATTPSYVTITMRQRSVNAAPKSTTVQSASPRHHGCSRAQLACTGYAIGSSNNSLITAILHARMPTKRSLPADHAAPPAPQRSAPDTELHLSPVRGLQPDMPMDAGVASAAPSSPSSSENCMPSPLSSPIRGGHQTGTASISASTEQTPPSPENLATNYEASSLQAVVLQPSIAANGGARAIHHAAQQQRVVTCNLSLIPPSECSISASCSSHHNCRCPTENTHLGHYLGDVYTTIWTARPHVHAGWRQHWSGWRDRVGRNSEPAHRHVRRHWSGHQHTWLQYVLLQRQTFPECTPQSRHQFLRCVTSCGMVDVEVVSSKHFHPRSTNTN